MRRKTQNFVNVPNPPRLMDEEGDDGEPTDPRYDEEVEPGLR